VTDIFDEIAHVGEGWSGHHAADTQIESVAPAANSVPALPDARRDHPMFDTHFADVSPSKSSRVPRKRVRGGHRGCETQTIIITPHEDPALPDSRIGQSETGTPRLRADAAPHSDPGDAGRESGHKNCDIQTRYAALATHPVKTGAEEGHRGDDTQKFAASSAEARLPRGKRGAVGQGADGTQAHRADSAKPIGSDADDPARHLVFDVPLGLASGVTIPEIGSNAEGGAGQTSVGTQSADADPATITAIRHHWRKRQAWHRAEKALTLQAKALCRGLTDGDKTEAGKLYSAALGDGEHPEAAMALGFIMPLIEARDGIEKHRKAVEKHLAEMAMTLPVSPWVKSVRGVGIASLAGVIGEAGDLSAYDNPGKLWKRMGVAPHHGRAYATWRSRGGLTSNDWTEAGYKPARRSVLWNIGACVVKAGGPLKTIYDERKLLEMAKCEAIAADPEQRKLFAKDSKYAPKLHAHNRAQRYIEKRFLRDLWREWRRAKSEVSEKTRAAVPAAESIPAMEDIAA